MLVRKRENFQKKQNKKQRFINMLDSHDMMFTYLHYCWPWKDATPECTCVVCSSFRLLMPLYPISTSTSFNSKKKEVKIVLQIKTILNENEYQCI